MATKEDILEQVVGEYLIHKGYFVQHNIKFRPRKDHPEFKSSQDSNHSDIDVLAYNPRVRGSARIMAVSCKSWQGGFDPGVAIAEFKGNKVRGGREAWKGFRELTVPKWSEAFIKGIEGATGSSRFTYVTAVTKLRGSFDNRAKWCNHPPFREALVGNPIKILTFKEMACEIQAGLTTTLAATEAGRMLQLLKASGVSLSDD